MTYWGSSFLETFLKSVGVYLLTDLAKPSQACVEGLTEPTEDECDECGGTGVSWVELLDVQGVN